VDPAEAVAGAIASAHACAACNKEFQDAFLRDFHGVPVCVDCYRDMNLLTLTELPAEPDSVLLGRLLSSPPAEVTPGPRRRFGVLDPTGAEQILLGAARAGHDTGVQEVLWVLLAADALLRSGGKNGKRPVEGKELSLLLNLAARVGMDVGWAAMVDAGVAKRTLGERGVEWVYEDTVAPGGSTMVGLAAEKDAFVRYMKAVKGKVDALASDVDNRDDGVDIAVGILKRTVDEVLAAFSMMDFPSKPKKGGAA
jgi:hypothetical protein